MPNQKSSSKPGSDQQSHVLVPEESSGGQHPVRNRKDSSFHQRLETRVSRYEQNGKEDRQYGRQESWQPGFGLVQNLLQLLIVDPQCRSGRNIHAAIDRPG